MSCHPTFRHLPKLQACLQSNDVNYRIAVGETIALLVELGRDVNEVDGWHRWMAKTQLYYGEVHLSDGALCFCSNSRWRTVRVCVTV